MLLSEETWDEVSLVSLLDVKEDCPLVSEDAEDASEELEEDEDEFDGCWDEAGEPESGIETDPLLWVGPHEASANKLALSASHEMRFFMMPIIPFALSACRKRRI